MKRKYKKYYVERDLDYYPTWLAIVFFLFVILFTLFVFPDNPSWRICCDNQPSGFAVLGRIVISVTFGIILDYFVRWLFARKYVEVKNGI